VPGKVRTFRKVPDGNPVAYDGLAGVGKGVWAWDFGFSDSERSAAPTFGYAGVPNFRGRILPLLGTRAGGISKSIIKLRYIGKNTSGLYRKFRLNTTGFCQ
jgi:hypothetical protein